MTSRASSSKSSGQAGRSLLPHLSWLYAIGIVSGLLVLLLVSFKAYSLSASMSPAEMWDAIKAAPNYQSVFLVNILVGISVLLLVVQLRADTLRVLLTVAVALLFGYLMTAFFNLDAANRFTQGEFLVSVQSEAASPLDLSYGDSLTAEFNDPSQAEPLTKTAYTFAGGAGNEVTILAYAVDPEAGLDLQVSLLGPDGAVLASANEATRRFLRQYDEYLKSEQDAVIKDFVLPADGLYTIVAELEGSSVGAQGTVGVTLLSNDKPPVGLAYNGPPVGGTFNAPKVAEPLKQAQYDFIGRAGDMVSVLAYAARANIEVDVQVSLFAPDGTEIGANNDATREQVALFAPALKSTRDAVIQNIVLPVSGVYTVRVQPEPVTTALKLSETFKATNKAYDAFLLGPLSRLNRWVIWVRDALTLIMLGLAIAIVFRAEQFSLGAEGQLYFGALVSGVIGLSFGNVSKEVLVPIALLSAATAGFLWGLLPGVLKAYLGANELVSTLMLNTIATRFYEMILTWQLKPSDAGYIASDWIPPNGLLSPLVDISGDQLSIAVYLLIALVVLTWLLIQRTPIGYEIRMIGANIKFAAYGGVNTRRTIMLAMAISGAVAGLAGAHLAMGVHRKLILNISLGLAFEGVVVALLARNNPLVVPFTGLLYAYLRTGAQVMERDANISQEVVRIIQAVVILLITAEALVSFLQRRRIRRRGTVELELEDKVIEATPAKEVAGG